MMVTSRFPRAFGVWFRDVRRWDPSSFQDISWHWPKEVMEPIGEALKIRKEKVDRKQVAFQDLQPITIHFDGSIDRRAVDDNREYTMDLFYARPGDIVVAKIDLKNGAVGIVPEGWENVVVTNHFAVYEPDLSKLVPDYLHRIIQTKFFKDHLWRNKVGAEGRKEVKLDFFEAQLIPMPSKEVQQAIVDRWKHAQGEIAASRLRVTDHEAEISNLLYTELGLQPSKRIQVPRAFAVAWENLFHWNGRATYVIHGATGLDEGKYPIVSGTECLIEVKHGCSASPSPVPTELEVLKISAVTRGEFMPQEKKFAFDVQRYREDFDLKKGDVLMCRTNGTLGYVGMSALVYEDMPNLIFPDKVIRVRAKPNMLPEYLWKVLQMQHLRIQIEAAARTAVGNYAIGTDDIWNFQIPLPPYNVQQEIMEKVAARRKEIERERKDVAQFSQEVEAQLEAIVLGTVPVE